MTNLITHSTPAAIDRYLSHTNHFIANFAPRPFVRDSSRVTIPYSMMMDAAKQGQSRIITAAASELEEKLIERLKRQKQRIQQTQEQFDTNYTGLSSSMKDAISDVYTLCRGYRDLILEQNQTIEQLSSDFQDQLSQIVRTFRNTLTEIDTSYRRKLSGPILDRIDLHIPVPRLTPEELVGRQVLVLVNLAPRDLKGITSSGMILMAEDASGKLRLLGPEDRTSNGAIVG